MSETLTSRQIPFVQCDAENKSLMHFYSSIITSMQNVVKRFHCRQKIFRFTGHVKHMLIIIKYTLTSWDHLLLYIHRSHVHINWIHVTYQKIMSHKQQIENIVPGPIFKLTLIGKWLFDILKYYKFYWNRVIENWLVV